MRNIPTHPGDDFTLPGQVTLVGAGPGDPELLTLKAVRAIQAATIVFVDDLVSDEVVGLASPSARVVHVGKRGGCKFSLADFRQVSARPSIELTERSGGSCKLLIWQAPARVTLAHAGCEKFCTGGVYEQAWPVMFEPSGGGCAKQ